MDNNLEAQPRQKSEKQGSHPDDKNSTLLTIKSFIFLGWITAVVAAYYVVHKPSFNFVALNGVIDLILALSIAGVTGALGFRILGSITGVGELEKAALHLAVGAGILGLSILGIGLLGLFSPWVAWLGLALGLFVLRRDIRAWVGQFKSLKTLFQQSEALGRFAGWFSIFAFVFSLFFALAPVLKWDSLVYHLELPKQYLEAGRVVFLDDNMFVGFPQLTEMFFTWSMALRSGTTAATTGWIFGVVAMIGVGGFAARIVGKKYALLAMAILLSGESIARSLGWAYVDVWGMLFALCVLIAFDMFHRSQERVWLLWAGILTGFAMGTKYPAYLLVILGIGLLLINRLLSDGLLSRLINPSYDESPEEIKEDRKIFADVLLFTGLAFLVALPWLAKNYIFSGNPVYPFFFPGRAMDALRQSFYTGLPLTQSLLDDLMLPLRATVLGVEGRFVFSTSIGPLMLALIPGLLLRNPRNNQAQLRSIIGLSIFGVGIWIFWAVGMHLSGPLASSRLYIFSFPAFAVLAAAGFRNATKLNIFQIRVGRVAGILVALALGLGFINQFNNFREKNPLSVVLDSVRQENYLAQELGWFAPVMDDINELPKDSRILFFWETRSFYCALQCNPDVVLDHWWHLRRTNADLDGILTWMQDEDYTHVLIYDVGAAFEQRESAQFEEADWIDLQQFREEQLTLIKSYDGVYSLYQVKTSN